LESGEIKAYIGNEAVIGPIKYGEIPEINSTVLESDSKTMIGRVSDVIGRVNAPYLVVKLSRKFRKKVKRASW